MKNPLIIFGMPRSGTTMLTNICNCHPDIYITDEMTLSIYKGLFEFSKTVSDTYEKYPHFARPARLWSERKANLVFEVWKNANKSPADEQRFNKAQIIGNKTPRAEVFYKKLDRLFGENKPKYIYCLRDAYKVMRSLKNMPWNHKTTEQNFADYLASVEKLKQIMIYCPERIWIFKVEQFGNEADSREQFCQNLFNFLELPFDEVTKHNINNIPVANTVNYVIKQTTINELTQQEKELIDKSPQYEAIKAEFFSSHSNKQKTLR